jgi:hypothetical protein
MLGWERGCCPYHQRLRRGHSYEAHVPLDDLFSGKVGGTELGTGAGNHYDRIYLWMGAEGIVADVNGKAGDIRLVDAKYKKPYIYTVQPDTDELKKIGVWPLPAKYFAYHVSSSGPTRTYPPALGKLAVEALLEAFPDHHAIVLGMDKSVDFRVDSKRVVDLFNATANIRTLFPVIQGAEFVVAPDSSVTHMAAGLDTACVSLLGSVTIARRPCVSIILRSVPSIQTRYLPARTLPTAGGLAAG